MGDEWRILRVAARRASLAAVSAFVRAAAEQAGLDTRAVYQVEMALDEAFSNVLDHAYAATERGDVEIRCGVEQGVFALIVRDWGKAFDPDSVPEPDLGAPLEERTLGGLGLYFMRSLMDSVEYVFDDGGNWLRMTKALHG